MLERFSFECRKVIGFEFATLHDWLKKFAPIFHPIRSKTKTKVITLANHKEHTQYSEPIKTGSNYR